MNARLLGVFRSRETLFGGFLQSSEGEEKEDGDNAHGGSHQFRLRKQEASSSTSLSSIRANSG